MIKHLKIKSIFSLLVEGVSESSLFDCSESSDQRYYAAPSDCHSFYQCFDKKGPPVKMSCGFLHFNPLASACDWPANVINIRPECDKTFKTFNRRRKQFGQKISASNSDSSSEKEVEEEGTKVGISFCKSTFRTIFLK